jgi:hypothetical protein
LVRFKTSFFALILFFSVSCQAEQENEVMVEYGEFPEINGRDLNKRDKVVPDDFVDKNLIIIVAFQQWHQPLVDESISLLESIKPD